MADVCPCMPPRDQVIGGQMRWRRPSTAKREGFAGSQSLSCRGDQCETAIQPAQPVITLADVLFRRFIAFGDWMARLIREAVTR